MSMTKERAAAWNRVYALDFNGDTARLIAALVDAFEEIEHLKAAIAVVEPKDDES